MLQMSKNPVAETGRKIIQITRGQKHGPVTRLVSPSDLGELIKPFVFLDIFDMETVHNNAFRFHPHSGIATITTIFLGHTEYEDSIGKKGLLNAGGVEWMKSGHGVWHTAAPAIGDRVYGYQLWLALPEAVENSAPESRYINPADVKAMVAFYEMVTNQTAEWLAPQFAEIVTPAATLAIGSAETVAVFSEGSAEPGANRTAILEFMVDDVDAVFDSLRDKAELVHEPKLLPWGNRSVQFRDPEGTVVSLFMPVTDAAKARFGSR